MSKGSPIPNLPPISAIQDPNVQAYLQALSHGWLVRNGQAGDGEEKFLTVRDLKTGVERARRGSGGGGSGARMTSASSAISDASGAVAAIISDLSLEIMNNRLWIALGARIKKIEMPEWFRGKFGAEIVTEQIRSQTATNALASQMTTAITNVNANVAIVQQTATAASDMASATASAVTALQVDVGSASANAEEALTLAANVDGTVEGAWTVKFDIDGYVTGIGLGLDRTPGEAPRSAFFIRADQFAIGPPSGGPVVTTVTDPATTMLPFIVSGGVVYIAKAAIKDADIDTLKIAGNAVTVPVGAYGTGLYPGAGIGVPINLVSVVLPGSSDYQKVLIVANCSVGYALGLKSTYWRLVRDVTILVEHGPISGAHESSPTICFVDTVTNALNHTYYLQWAGEDSTVSAGKATITVLGVKR